jgi:predicted DNA-binding transcriptional regulator AlpA
MPSSEAPDAVSGVLRLIRSSGNDVIFVTGERPGPKALLIWPHDYSPEVMVKVTGGGTRRRTVAAHLSYISRKGQLEIETDESDRIGKKGQPALLQDWHLDLSPGQYRKAKDGKPPPRAVKLTYNIVLSMPKPTPPEEVLAAAKASAREKFGVKHRYVMVLHTHQEHPHVHLVVKAEGHDGRRLHIDKVMLREWREDFARLMRAQGVAANATPRIMRGRSKRSRKDAVYRTQPSRSHALRARVHSIATELSETGAVTDPARATLLKTRKAVISARNRNTLERPQLERAAGTDQVLSTRDVERITGRHRCTIYRWVRACTFPGKRAGRGRGWLRSEVDRWLQGGGSGIATRLPARPWG